MRWGRWRAGLGRRPTHRIVALVVLTLGLVAAVSVFTYARAFSRPFPGVEAGGLVRVFERTDEDPFLDLSFLDFEDYVREVRGLEGLAAAQPYYAASVRLEELTDVAFVEAVTGDYFEVLGAGAALGRPLEDGDDRLDAEPAAVISHRWWQSRFGGDPDVLGRTVYLNYRPFTVVGVADPAFVGTASDFRPHVWIPVAHFRDRYTGWDAQAQDRTRPLVRVFGRLAPGVTAAVALEELGRVAGGLDQAYPGRDDPRRPHLRAATWIDPSVRLAEASRLRVMTLSALGFLLLVCANVANLLLAVSVRSQRELAVRAALGASPVRLFVRTLAGNVGLALVAGVVAIGLALPATRRLGGYFSRPGIWGDSVAREFGLDGPVVLFALAAAALTGLAAGILPALRASRRDLGAIMVAGESGGGPPRRIAGRAVPGARDLLMAGQVALSVALLVVAGLLIRTLAVARDVDPGFAYADLVASHVSTSSTNLEVEEREAFFREVERRIAEEPWVRSATVSDNAPLSGHASVPVRTEAGEPPVPTLVSRVYDGFFAKLDVERVEGRTFTASDTAGADPVVVLNAPAARRFFGDASAVGRRVWLGEDDDLREAEVVGVVGDTRVRDFLASPEPAVYRPYAQTGPYPSGSALLVRTRGDPEARVADLHRWLREHEPHLAIVNAISYRDVVRGATYAQRMNAEMFAALAVLGLILSAVGVFGVVSLAVGRRTREIGIRKALGARSREIHRLVVLRALEPVAVGVGLGLAVALGLSRLLEGLLYGVEPLDPPSIALGAALLVACAALAAYLPSRRAAAVDPRVALKAE